ncbi:hypothetical protein MUU72_21875 [Streptomyces sp. RS10V-4]|uniref:hypothetical protein n=1 Tax=Streptomyces rhizoryzae TaxID=2932493 RepID=UPI0020058B23|nr:hypothetical protein [Streptomyces rhizoryzae]MCK7625716.1 hypothetical protein [Streptomyces rhizoryzae]
MRTAGGVRRARTAAVAVAAVTAAAVLAGCGAGGADGKDGKRSAGGRERPGGPAGARPGELAGVGPALRSRVPADARQAVVVRGAGADSPDATVTLYDKGANGWRPQGSWPAHNGRRGWTADHHEGDQRSPIGVFALTDAGGVLPDPGSRLPYTHSAAFTPPSYWSRTTRHDFDYVVAIDYNRVPGTSPLDPTRPLGQAKGGGVWLHLDHGSGTSACVSVAKPAMAALLRALDPARHPVVVMGDQAHLAG